MIPPTPESVELARKLAELDALEELLAQRELELATLESELAAFHARCLKRLGPLYAELDELRARVATARAHATPLDEGAGHQAEEARLRADDTAQQAQFYASMPEPPEFEPLPDIKQLYRETARRVHPDRAADAADRARRHEWMSRANRAYRDGDRAGLRTILRECVTDPDDVCGDDVAAALVRAIRRAARVQDRLADIDRRVAALIAGDMCRLMERVRRSAALSREPFDELAANLRREIAATLRELAACYDSPLSAAASSGPAGTTAPLGESTPKLPECVHETTRGERVRHAGEAVIAAVLHELGIDYRYKQPIVGTLEPGVRRPSFAVRGRAGRWIVWRHCAAQGDADSARRDAAWFEGNGYVPGITLFATSEAPDGTLDAARVREIAEYLQLMLRAA